MVTSKKTGNLWNNPNFRSGLFQVLLISAIAACAWILLSNTMQNLETRGISSGFGFLQRAAGFDIDFTLISFTPSDTNLRVFWVGLLNTLFFSSLGIILATTIGVIIGVGRLSDNWMVEKLATVYVEIFRNIPLLLQIFFWYFAVLGALPSIRDAMQDGGLFDGSIYLSNRGVTLPKPIFESTAWLPLCALLLGIIIALIYRRYADKKQQQTGQQSPVLVVSLTIILGLPILALIITGLPVNFDFPTAGRFNFSGGFTIIPEFLALLFAISIYTAAFIAEIVRAGIQSVSHGQTEAALSLGLKPAHTLRLVIMPQALRVIIPPLASQYLNLVKNSSLAAAIAYPELVSFVSGTILNNSGQALECIAMTMTAYLVLSLSIAAFMNWYNKRIMLIEK